MDSELLRRIQDPGFTPSVKRLGELLEFFAGDDEVAKAAERAVLRIETQYAARVAEATVTAARGAVRPARGRLTQLAARLAKEPAARSWLFEALADADPKTRRAAARGLGKLERSTEIESALAAAFDRTADEDDRRVLGEALGKIGGEAARTRTQGRAALIAERDRARTSRAGEIDPARSHDGPLPLRFHTRSGLEDVLRDEIGDARFVAPGIVEATHAGPLAKALAVRTATHVGFPIALGEGPRAEAIVEALGRARSIFQAFSDAAQIRFRISFSRGGHRRSLVWHVAELVRDTLPWLINDPRESTWEVVVDQTWLELVPRAFTDERFAYRQDLVAAASHPVIAAALARLAPRRDDDVVWDPFTGSGAELIERARLGPYARLVGTDLDPAALDAARANFERAGLTGTLEQADACDYVPEGLTLAISNPPMGRRVQRGMHADLLQRFVTHAARILPKGGHLVWLAPAPRPNHEGLTIVRSFSVDMGGFSAELIVARK